MARITPTSVQPPETGADDPRVGRLLGARLRAGEPPAAVVLGFPTDEGVRRNGGRPGAAEGPSAIRGSLYRLAPDARSSPFEELLGRTSDLGDLVISGNLEQDQRNLGK